MPPPSNPQLREAAERATPGPWHLSGGRCDLYDGKTPVNGHTVSLSRTSAKEEIAVAHVFYDKRTGEGFADAAFIALANPATVLSLLDRLAAAEAERDEARSLISEYMSGERAQRAAAQAAEARATSAEAQRDEALAFVAEARQAVENWFAPWGSWKTAWWEDFGNDGEYSAENFIKAIGRRAASLFTRLGKGEGK